MIICIVGPTACYKSQTAIALAKLINGEILSCDSVAVYKGMDIGSAKPTREERSQVPHHLIDIVSPFDNTFSASEFRRYADAAIEECIGRNNCPILAGGSGMYFDAVMHPMSFACPADSEVRKRLEMEYDNNPSQFLHDLSKVDSIASVRIPINDKKRLVRAMEVFELSGKPFSSFGDDYYKAQQTFRYDSIRIGLNLPRAILYERIEKRVDIMMSKGLLEEVKKLASDGLSDLYPSMQSIGYSQILHYLNHQCSLDQAISDIKKTTRHFAKRQITWFKRDDGIVWFDCSEYEETLHNIIKYVTEKLNESD